MKKVQLHIKIILTIKISESTDYRLTEFLKSTTVSLPYRRQKYKIFREHGQTKKGSKLAISDGGSQRKNNGVKNTNEE